VRFDGDTPQSVRDEAKLDFDRRYCEAPDYNNGNGPKWQVLLANYKTGGVGLNFTAATEMIELDQEWNPGKEDQARGRIDRMGQVSETNVHVINIERTIDGWMSDLNEEKAQLIDGFNSMAEPLSTQLLDAMKNGDML
jgi:SNF2 family DNA or RNA helicase